MGIQACTPLCEDGYTLVGDTTLECETGGLVDGSYECEPNPCAVQRVQAAPAGLQIVAPAPINYMENSMYFSKMLMKNN